MSTIAILGTYDSKGVEHAFLADKIRARGHRTLLIDAGSLAQPALAVDVPSSEVAKASGRSDWQEVLKRQDRGECVSLMAAGAQKVLENLVAQGRVDGVISLGGGGGTAICTQAMRALPIGLPKLMVSTLASGNTAPYVGTRDITMMPAIADVAGINRLTRLIFDNAAGAICGMVEAAAARQAQGSNSQDKPLVVASMFGNTTACVTRAKEVLEQAGYEVLVFAATGNGGRSMEALIESGLVSGVLDITTTEWADELCGGVLSAGPTRLEAAGKMGLPAVVAPGCLDMVNFGEAASVPAQYKDRCFYVHNAQVTLMRTTAAENRELGRIIAAKLNAYSRPPQVMVPTRAISVISAKGKPFHDAQADAALLQSLRDHLKPEVSLHTLDCEINDPLFAEACAKALLDAMAAAKASS